MSFRDSSRSDLLSHPGRYRNFNKIQPKNFPSKNSEHDKGWGVFFFTKNYKQNTGSPMKIINKIEPESFPHRTSKQMKAEEL